MLSPVTTTAAVGMRKSASAGNIAALAASAQQQHPVLHTGVSRLRAGGIPRATSHASLASSAHEGSQAKHAVSRHATQQPIQQQALEDVKQRSAGVSEASTSASQAPGVGARPFASLTRVFLIGQPSNIMRNLAGRKFRAAGPVSLLLFLFGLVLAILTAVRSVLVRRVRSCQCCKGFGITRCRLCNGEGAVEWAGKNNHQEMCPLCMTKRYVTCPDCGGYYHRPMFGHIQTNGRGPVTDFLGA